MKDDFSFNSRGTSAKQRQDDPNAVMAGLREAQEELEGFVETPPSASEESPEENEMPLPSAQNDFESQIENYAARIQDEKSKLKELQAYIDEVRGTVEKRIERIGELEQAVEKVRENLRIIGKELNEGEGMSDKILSQIKQKSKGL